MIELNEVKIVKNDDLKCKVYINGVLVEKVLDFSYRKTSAQDTTEVLIKIVADEFTETFQ